MTTPASPGAAREGRALLQGLVRCGQCGRRMIEAAVVEAFLEVTAAGGAEAAALADEQRQTEIAAAETAWRLPIEQAEYEVQRAERQYLAVEPEHGTVARELERRWNHRLEELHAVRANAAGALDHRRPLTDAERERAQELGQHLGRDRTAMAARRSARRTAGCARSPVADRTARRGPPAAARPPPGGSG